MPREFGSSRQKANVLSEHPGGRSVFRTLYSTSLRRENQLLFFHSPRKSILVFATEINSGRRFDWIRLNLSYVLARLARSACGFARGDSVPTPLQGLLALDLGRRCLHPLRSRASLHDSCSSLYSRRAFASVTASNSSVFIPRSAAIYAATARIMEESLRSRLVGLVRQGVGIR